MGNLRLALFAVAGAALVLALGHCTGADPAALDTGADDGGDAACVVEAGAACWPGAAEARGVGACRDGQLACLGGDVVCAGALLPVAETCNEVDDDCNGMVDDGFDLLASALHCGSCNHACTDGGTCVDGGCFVPAAEQCDNDADDDGDGLKDCADPDCEGKACGPGCLCKSLHAIETNCSNHVDDNRDGHIDCLDPTCAGADCDGTAGTKRCTNLTCK